MKKKYSIYAVTSSRADYGLLRPMLRKIENEKNIDLTVVATGSHGSKKLGSTFTEIKKDKYKRIKKKFFRI